MKHTNIKRLVVSCKTADQVFADFKKAAKRVQNGTFKGETEYEVSFDNKTDFNRFVRNIPVLSAIIVFKPRSVYELAKLIQVDISNLNKTIQFFEEIGVIQIKEKKIDGRTVKQPHVEYEEVTFRLAA
jgi:predicted transcriptional regulator